MEVCYINVGSLLFLYVYSVVDYSHNHMKWKPPLMLGGLMVLRVSSLTYLTLSL